MVGSGETLPFDILLATPETEKLFRQYGRILGPKGLMPSEKRGTVVSDFAAYGQQVEKGVELKLDSEGKSKRGAMLRVVVGKVLLFLLFQLTESSNKLIKTFMRM